VAQREKEDAVILRQATKRRKSLLLLGQGKDSAVGKGLAFKRSASLRSANSLDSNPKNAYFVVDADEEEKDNTQDLEDKVTEQHHNKEAERRRLENPDSNSAIREDDEESYEQAVQDFLNDVNNNTPEENQNNGNKLFNNARSRTVNAFAIKGSAYNDVRISGASRQNKIFTSIDRHQGPKNHP